MIRERIVIDDVHPRTPTAFPAKAVVGEYVPVSADIFKDGHDILNARVRWRAAGARAWQSAPMAHEANDRWTGLMVPTAIGPTEFLVEAWLDTYRTWAHKIEVKLHAGQDVSVELAEGNLLFAARAAKADASHSGALQHVADMLADDKLDHASRTASALTDDVAELMSQPGKTDDITAQRRKLWVDRERAGSGAWYCVFPRSWGGLKGLTEELDYIASMKFDVVYLTPIHPIGTTFRKGKNNTLDPTAGDVGVPYAIGSPEGGHTDIHPELGTIADFDRLVKRAQDLGMEIALDNALQCSPDHPWVKDHPEWFNHRPDGSIAYAENPPKKYQDIYPINFWPDREEDRVALWNACKEIFDYWIGHGVKIFRVDNPHTKPMAFWAWCIGEVQKVHPDVIFLSEAFTRPKVMAKLAEIGFTQSYTYFTWRTTKQELVDYGVEVSVGPSSEYMRPNFWPNTHDILLPPLRNAPLGAFKMRMVLAATMVPNYGIYSGYELGENEPLSEANTEYLASEKYEIKTRNFDVANSLRHWVGLINDTRRRHPALNELHNIWFHGADNDQMLAYSKRDATGTDVVLVVVNLDTANPQSCTVDLDLEQLGVHWNQPYEVFDEVTGRSYFWAGSRNYVWLDPGEPAHVFHIRQA